jgi:hypothetical protein
MKVTVYNHLHLPFLLWVSVSDFISLFPEKHLNTDSTRK